MKFRTLLVVVITLLMATVLLPGCSGSDDTGEPDDTPTPTENQTPTLDPTITATPTPTPTETVAPSGNPVAIIHTNMGDIKIELFRDKVPATVDNFVNLANDGFYDGIIFHRVIKNFMIQTGDPTGTGRGGPGYRFNDEFDPSLRHDKLGVVSMANSGPNTNGSQFFITLKATPWLNDKHSVFGQVIEGLEVVDQIGAVDTNTSDRPLTDVVMEQVTIEE